MMIKYHKTILHTPVVKRSRRTFYLRIIVYNIMHKVLIILLSVLWYSLLCMRLTLEI